MNQTSFTLVGFTQPHTAMPIIEDLDNNAKVFTSRILWYFPKLVFCKMQETRLTLNEKSTVAQFTDQFGETLLLSICH